MRSDFAGKLASVQSQITEMRKEIQDTGCELSRAMKIEIGDLAEIKMWGTSIILGGYGYLGLIDDDRKKITRISLGSGVCERSFGAVYGPLERSGYTTESPAYGSYLGQDDDAEMLKMLVDRKIVNFAMSILMGKHVPSPKEVGFTYLDGEKKYEMGKMFGNAGEIGGSLGLALGLNAAVKAGMPIIQAAPSQKNSFETRVEQAFVWPTKPDLVLEANTLEA